MINSKKAGIMESRLVQIIFIAVFIAVAIGIYLLITGRLNLWAKFIFNYF